MCGLIERYTKGREGCMGRLPVAHQNKYLCVCVSAGTCIECVQVQSDFLGIQINIAHPQVS